MKRLYLLLILSIVGFISISAQTTAEKMTLIKDYLAENATKFLTVKGIELKPNMEMKYLLNEVEKKGWRRSDLFNEAYDTYGIYDLRGSFFNNYCKIKILPIHGDKKIVGIIGINLPERDSFKQLKKDYDNLKAALAEKYYMFENTESFDDNYVNESTSDYLKLNALSKDEGLFESRFQISEDASSMLLGYIVLKISHLTFEYETSYYVSVSYCTSDCTIEQINAGDDDL